MEKIVYVWKPVRLTPLEVISLFKQKYPMHKDEKISYAGRLDPMAEGILILLIGNENKNRDKYLGLDKVYESEIIFGISTDSFEGLGKIIDVNFDSKISEEGIRNVLNNLMGERIQEYPPFSSKTVSGKPLFWWAREGKIDQIRIPKRKIKIHAIDLLDTGNVKVGNLVEEITKNIKKVKGEFRQEEVSKLWEDFGIVNKDKEVLKVRIKVNCSSGTYIRRIANDLGNELGVPAFAYSIKRVSIGDINESSCLKFI